MSKKSGRLLKTKKIKKALRRNRKTIGVTALAVGGIAAAAMSPKLRQRTSALKDRLMNRLSSSRDHEPSSLPSAGLNGSIDHTSEGSLTSDRA